MPPYHFILLRPWIMYNTPYGSSYVEGWQMVMPCHLNPGPYAHHILLYYCHTYKHTHILMHFTLVKFIHNSTEADMGLTSRRDTCWWQRIDSWKDASLSPLMGNTFVKLARSPLMREEKETCHKLSGWQSFNGSFVMYAYLTMTRSTF